MNALATPRFLLTPNVFLMYHSVSVHLKLSTTAQNQYGEIWRVKRGSPEESGNVKLRLYLKQFVSAACGGFRSKERQRSHFTARAYVVSPFSASAQQVCALAYSSHLLQRYRTAVCTWTACLPVLSVHGRVPLHAHLMTVASSYVSICVGSRVCVNLQTQASFKERNDDAYNYFLQNSVRVETSPRRQKPRQNIFLLKKANPISLALRTVYLLARTRTESVFPLKALLET